MGKLRLVLLVSIWSAACSGNGAGPADDAGDTPGTSAEVVDVSEEEAAVEAATVEYCGDSVCQEGENCLTCETDCGECCGNAVCDEFVQEDCGSCPEDCGECCGDAVCDELTQESCQSCPADCGECCGDTVCDESGQENCGTCPADCGDCCGDGLCDPEEGEGCVSCTVDCGECDSACGDAVVDVEMGEECDDGNTEVGDGCDDACWVEPVPAAPGDIIITEAMKNPAAVADAAGEWFELYNATDADIDMNGWWIEDLATDKHKVFSYDGVTVPAKSYFVMTWNGDSESNGGIESDCPYSTFQMLNIADEIILKSGTDVVDAVAYDTVEFPNTAGKALSLSPGALDAELNDAGKNWCDSPADMENGDFGSPGEANPPCPVPPCGNGDVEDDEECDDGNTESGDGCSSTCTIELEPGCGNGVLEDDEECDDGNLEILDGCDDNCLIEIYICGNSIVEPFETCDDGNAEEGDGCDPECQIEYPDPICGNGILEGPPGETWPDGGGIPGSEYCDDGNTEDGDGCSSECEFEDYHPWVCGDGLLEVANDEQCDDGNKVSGDGCDEWCKIECSGACEPCGTCCGDGLTIEGEECDDGNADDGDGCSGECKFEAPESAKLSGTVYFEGNLTGADILYVMAFDSPTSNPLTPGDLGSSLSFAYTAEAVFPAPYDIPILPGTYWMMAILDVEGEGGDGTFAEEDFGIFYTLDGQKTAVEVDPYEQLSGIDFVLPSQGSAASGSLSGTISFSGEVSDQDSLTVLVSGKAPPLALAIAKSVKIKPVSFPQAYSMLAVVPNYFYVVAILDRGDDNDPEELGPGDLLGVYPNPDNPLEVQVGEQQDVVGIDFEIPNQ